MVDIASEQELLEYLARKKIFAAGDEISLVYFGGGVSGVVALATDGNKEIILKQALAKLKVKDDWRCDPERIITEHNAHETYMRLVPEYVPETLFADKENNLIVRIAAPNGALTWKELLLSGDVDFRIAKKAIDALRTVHDESAKDKNILEKFEDNQVFYELRISPYIERVVEKHPDLAARAEPVIHRLMHEKISLNHGDFSPKNIMIADGKIFILDFEVAHWGYPSFDLAFFFNHFILKAVKNRQWRDAYLNMLLYMADEYFSRIECVPSAQLQRETVELLAFMLLARVDGKSPAEYITADTDKSAIRSLAYGIFDKQCDTLDAVAGLARNLL